jgi:hypothetical protein
MVREDGLLALRRDADVSFSREQAKAEMQPKPVARPSGFTLGRALKAAEDKNRADAYVARALLCATQFGDEVT